MKYCSNCGNPIDDNAQFCPECGAQQAPAMRAQGPGPDGAFGQQAYGNGAYGNATYGNRAYGEQPYGEQPYGNNQGAYGGGIPAFAAGKERNIVLCILFTIITCGLYGIYWMICLNDEINLLSNEERPTSGVMVLVFSIITCGIYMLYWYYKMGSAVDRIKGSDGNRGLLYLLLAIFQLHIVDYIMMQDTINRAVTGAV